MKKKLSLKSYARMHSQFMRHIRHVCLVPLKAVTILRLKLYGALLLAKLAFSVFTHAYNGAIYEPLNEI